MYRAGFSGVQQLFGGIRKSFFIKFSSFWLQSIANISILIIVSAKYRCSIHVLGFVFLNIYRICRCISRPPKIRRKFTILCFLFYFIYDSVYKSRSIFLGRFLIEKGRLIHRQIR